MVIGERSNPLLFVFMGVHSNKLQYFYGVRAVFVFFYFCINENLDFVTKKFIL